MSHETPGKSNEYYTPKYVFDALECTFDTDVASPVDRSFCHVPAKEFITEGSLDIEWNGFVWMNPPYGNEALKKAFLQKIYKQQGGGISKIRLCIATLPKS